MAMQAVARSCSFFGGKDGGLYFPKHNKSILINILGGFLAVVSDEFELVSARSGWLFFMPSKDRATRQEQRLGFV